MIFQHKLIGQLKKHQDKTAIEYGSEKSSYAALLSASNKVTQLLLEKKLTPETIVGIQLSNRVDIISSMIGVMNARCVFVPIDANLPTQRLQQIVDDLQLEYVICSKKEESLVALNTQATLNPLYFEDIQEQKDVLLQEEDYPTYGEDDSLYIYFTSGSTGKPKGVIGKNKSLSNFIEWEIEEFSIDDSFRFSQFVSPFFDAFLRDVFVPLMAGATICIPTLEEEVLDPKKLISWIDASRINLIHCVPSLFRLINEESLTAENYLNLKYVLLSGEKINPSDLKPWYHLFNDRIQLVNLYGTTEATMISSFYKITPADAEKAKMSIGKGIRNNELRILNKDLKPCKPLIVGDLFIVSDYSSKGYFNAEELTKEKFIVLNSETGGDEFAYKTGDKARRLINGTLELLGREDRQIKLRGIRISLDEIEQVLLQSELVKNAIVVLHVEEDKENNIRNEFLVAFLIAENAAADLSGEIDTYLKDSLPEYMMPSKVVVKEEFPLLSNGKIDYKELRASLNISEATIVAPIDETEHKILEIWQQILGDKPMSTTDKFHEIGGNSLSIMRLIARIFKEYNIRISLNENKEEFIF